MKVQTLSVVAGTMACNARCPFCVARLTHSGDVTRRLAPINYNRLRIACRLAAHCGATTCLITGKGEPTLFRDQVSEFIKAVEAWLPVVELQTNGLTLDALPLASWVSNGLTTVALSVVHWNAEKNREIYTPSAKEYPDLAESIRTIHAAGLSVRLCCMLVKGYIDHEDAMADMVNWAHAHSVEQLTMRPIVSTDTNGDAEAATWAQDHGVKEIVVEGFRRNLERVGTKLMALAHGGIVYDVAGQNVCLYNCLTLDAESDDLRQLIYFPDGHIRYDWRYPGAILL